MGLKVDHFSSIFILFFTKHVFKKRRNLLSKTVIGWYQINIIIESSIEGFIEQNFVIT